LTDYKLGEWLEVSATGGASRLPYKKKKMIANVINSSANKNNAAIRQTELSVVCYNSHS